MSLLGQVTKGKVFKPYFVTIFGPEGVGKSTFGAEAPDPIFACTEDGSDRLDVNRLPKITSFEVMMDAIEELSTTNHPYKSFIIDSLDHLEPLIWDYVSKENKWKNIEDAGFGKGYVAATQVWGKFFAAIKKLREKMNVILICHSQVKSFNDPSLPAPYDRYELKLHKGANALVRENCDAILFFTYDTIVSIDKSTKRGKGFGGDLRYMYTEYRAHHDGKNRYGLPYKIEMPVAEMWHSFDAAVKSGTPESADVINSQISGLLSKLVDEQLKEKANEQFLAAKTANDVKKLVAIKNRLLQVTQE